MQPLERKQTKIQSGVARARVLLKRDLPWLPGYPLGTAACVPSDAHRVLWGSSTEFCIDKRSIRVIDREGLRRAQMTITKLRYHFPRALPKLVSDVDDWFIRIELLLKMLKDAVHNGTPLLSADVLRSGVLPKRWTEETARIKTTYPALASLMDAVTFSTLSDLQSAQDDQIEWIERHAEPLSDLCELKAKNACELPMFLLSVRDAFSPTLFQTLVRCLTDTSIRQCRWESMDKSTNRLVGLLKKAVDQNDFALPKPLRTESLSALVRSVLCQIASQRPKRRRETFGLLEQLLNPELINAIAESQRELSGKERKIRRLLRRVQSGHEAIPRTKSERKVWLDDARGNQDIRVTTIATAKALGKMLCGILNDGDATGEPWTRFLAAFPAQHAGLAVRLTAKWRFAWYGSKERKNDLSRTLGTLSYLLQRRGVATPLLSHWRDHVDGNNTHYEFVADTSYGAEGNPKLVKRAVALLEKTVYDLQLNLGSELLASLVEFAKVTNDDTRSSSTIELLSKNPDAFCDDARIRIAILFGDSPAETAQILISLKKSDDLERLEKELKPLASDLGLRHIIAKRITEGESASLKRLTATIGILNDLGCPLPKRDVISKPLDWCSRFPDDFAPALQSLSESTPDSEQIAERLLGKVFPTRDTLQRQIDALRSKLARGVRPEFDEDRMRRRLDNLRRRQDKGFSVSPARRNDLIKKLARRAEDETLQRYTLRCRQQVAATIGNRFDVQEFPEDLLFSPLDRVLREITRLSKSMRNLGIRLLFESAQRTTSNFDNEPKNLAFTRRMQSIGINMRPWLNDQLRQQAKTADGTPYELAFTRDAIDILLMGFHFDTCLSPDSFNFFSTVANAVDLNKRVVYGKTEAGKVIGRCLFALNEYGEILTYYRYSHDAKDGFADAVDQFANRLAGEMQTSLGSGGKVATLVARDWYDDGPIGGNLEWLGEGGIANDLANRVDSSQLLSSLIDAVGENAIRQRVVEVATQASLRDRPEFLSALMDRFGSRMNFRQRFVVAVNIEPEDLRARLLSQMRWSEIIRLVHRHQCDECDVFHGIADYATVFRVLTQFHPSLGLRAIRAARPASIQNDLQDPNKTRRAALIEAHQQLGRLHLAERLLKE